MIALKIAHNGAEVCTAGVGDDGMIGMSMHWVRRTGARAHPDADGGEEIEFGLHVGGIHSPSNHHHNWDTPELRVGDSVTVTVVETEQIDPPDATSPATQAPP